jgi:pimeloyl-ACP methyl ester carboxylesterase
MTRAFSAVATVLGIVSYGATASPEAQIAATAMVDVGVAQLETVSWGDGEVVILLPGSGYSVKAFELLGPEIAHRGYRAVAVNPRGVGKSVGPRVGLTYHDYAADVGAVIDRVAGGRAHVLGWAWGNRIARCLAADSPGRVASITLIAAGGKFPSDPSLAALSKQIAEPGVSADERDRLRALRMLAPGSDVRPLLSITESWPQGGGGGTPLADWWAGGSAPMLVIQGLQDKVAPPANGRDLKSSYPDRVTLVEVDAAGHGIVVEHPARLADETVRFLREHPVQRRR